MATGQTAAGDAEVLAAEGVSRAYRAGGGTIWALREATLRVESGEMVALRGRSGAGKTTLLALLTGLDDPTEGTVTLGRRDLRDLGEAERAALRRSFVGMLFQAAHLFPVLTAAENVEVPLRMARVGASERRERAREALARVGLTARAHHRAAELSGGEQQRIALARALVHHPRALVADEPTGNLDTRTGREMAALLAELARERGMGVLVATHDQGVVAAADRVLSIDDGVVREG